jgi:hypothetical protein
MEHPILCKHYSNCQTGVSPCLHLLHHPNQKPPYVLKWFNWPKFKFRETPQAEFNFLESQTSLAALIQVSRPQTFDKRTVRSVALWNFLLNELRPQKCKSLKFPQKNQAAKFLATWQLMDVLPRLKLLSALRHSHTDDVFPSYVIDSQKEFIWTKKHDEGLNLNCRSISGLEPKRQTALYHFFTQHSGILGISPFHLLSAKLHPSFQLMCISVIMVFITLRTVQLK